MKIGWFLFYRKIKNCTVAEIEEYCMDKFWSLFWKLFAVGLGVSFAVSIILGIAWHSGDLTYSIVQKIIAVAMGLCGFIAMIVVPIELYVIDRGSRMKNSPLFIRDGSFSSGGNHGIG